MAKHMAPQSWEFILITGCGMQWFLLFNKTSCKQTHKEQIFSWAKKYAWVFLPIWIQHSHFAECIHQMDSSYREVTTCTSAGGSYYFFGSFTLKQLKTLNVISFQSGVGKPLVFFYSVFILAKIEMMHNLLSLITIYLHVKLNVSKFRQTKIQIKSFTTSRPFSLSQTIFVLVRPF